MQQHCNLWAVWLTWLGLPALALVVAWRQGWIAAALVLALGIAAQILYVRLFPRLSPILGYGSVEDVPATEVLQMPSAPGVSRVTMYTANVCPFCPIMKRRLADLQKTLHFELEERDVTFHPEIMRAKGLMSVPVIELNGKYLIGNRTSAAVAAFLMDASGHPGPGTPS